MDKNNNTDPTWNHTIKFTEGVGTWTMDTLYRLVQLNKGQFVYEELK